MERSDKRNSISGGAAARVLLQQPQRLAAAWRRVRHVELRREGQPSGAAPLLDGLVEPFLREIGASLVGAPGSAWERTPGVLRLSQARGARALYVEFAALRRCLEDTLDALQASDAERRTVSRALDEAVDSAVALLERLASPGAEGPRVPFGGLVLEVFERTPRRAPRTRDEGRRALH